MNDLFKDVMIEATRLTQSGRFAEASALIRRALAGDSASGVERGDPSGDAVSSGDGEAGDADSQGDGSARSPAAWSSKSSRGEAEQVGSGSVDVSEMRFEHALGSRSCTLLIPDRCRAGRCPVLVMLHGCGQDAEALAQVSRMNAVAAQAGLIVAYPEQASSANGSGCWNWYSPEHQARGRGEPSIIADLASHIVSRYGADASRVYIAGFSAGGAMAAVAAAAYPERFAALGVHSGLPVGVAQDGLTAMLAMAQGPASFGRDLRAVSFVPTIVLHGERDMTVHPASAPALIAQFLAGADERSGGGSLGLHVQRRDGRSAKGRAYRRTCFLDGQGGAVGELWLIRGAGHGWSGGSSAAAFAEPDGPDASRAMVRFFLSR